MKIDRRFTAIFLVFTISGLSGAGVLFFFGNTAIKTTEVYFYPSDPWDWTQVNSSFQLHGRFYFPINYVQGEEYPTAIMFHSLGWDLEVNDDLSVKLAAMGILVFSISFRGHGNSGGVYDPIGWPPNQTENFGDVLGTYRYALEQSFVDESQMLVFGQSLGGGAALYLAELGLVPKFVVWYPAIDYIVRDFTLYQHNSSDPDFEGYIIAGTNDECGTCTPAHVEEFVENNPSVEIHWNQGATHLDGDFYLTCLDLTVSWVSGLWSIPELNWLVDWYTSWVLGVLVAGFVVIVDILWLIKRQVTKKKRKK